MFISPLMRCAKHSAAGTPMEVCVLVKNKAVPVKFLYINVKRHTAVMLYHKCNGTKAPWTGWLILAPCFANIKRHRTFKYIVHIHACV